MRTHTAAAPAIPRPANQRFAAAVRLAVAVLISCGLQAASPAGANTRPFGEAEKSLFDAIARDDQPAVDEAITAGANLNLPSPKQGLTALVMAIRAEHFDIARHLVEKGADPWLTTSWNEAWIEGDKSAEPYTALDAAARCGSVEMCVFLLSRGTPPREVFDGDGKARRGVLYPALQGGSVAVVELLLKHGAKLQPDPLFGVPPLCYAAFRGHPELVDWLLAKGENPNSLGDDRAPVIANAARNGDPHVIKSLLKAGAKIDWAETRKFANVLHICIDLDRPTAFEIFLDQHPPQEALDRALAFVDSLEFWERNPCSIHYYNRLIAAGAKSEAPSLKAPLPIAVPAADEPSVAATTGLTLLPLPNWKTAKPSPATAKLKLGIIADPGSQDLAALLSATLTAQSGFELLERIDADKIAREIGLNGALSGTDLSIRAAGLLEGCDLLILLRKQKIEKTEYLLADLSAAASGVQIASVILDTTNVRKNAEGIRRLIDERSWLLRADPKSLIAAAIVNITSDGTSRSSEKLVANLIGHRISMMDGVVLLDRENVTQLSAEQKSGGTRFRAGTFLINGRFSGELRRGNTVEVLLEGRNVNSGALAQTTISGDGGEIIALAMRASDGLLTKLLQKSIASKNLLDPKQEVDRILKKIEWCIAFGLHEETASAADAALALGGPLVRLRSTRASALLNLTDQEAAREELLLRGNKGRSIDESVIARLVPYSLRALDAVEEFVRMTENDSTHTGFYSAGGIGNAFSPFALLKKESDRARFATQIEKVRTRFLRIWDFLAARILIVNPGTEEGIRVKMALEQCERLAVSGWRICSNDDQYLDLLKKVANRAPATLLGIPARKSKQKGGRTAFEGYVAVFQRLGQHLAASPDPYTRLVGLDLVYRFDDDQAKALQAARQSERYVLDRIQKTNGPAGREERLQLLSIVNRDDQPLWDRDSDRSDWPGWRRIESWDGTSLRNPKRTKFVLEALCQNAGPFPKESVYLEALGDWRALTNAETLGRELTREQLGRVREEADRQASAANQALGKGRFKKIVVSATTTLRQRLAFASAPFVVAAVDSARPTTSAKAIGSASQVSPSPATPQDRHLSPMSGPVEIGKPLFEEILAAIGVPNAEGPAIARSRSAIAYDGSRFFVCASASTLSDRKLALLEIDPATRRVKAFPAPIFFQDLTFSGGKLIGHSRTDVWIRQTDTTWHHVYKATASKSFLFTLQPELHGNHLVLHRNLDENEKSSAVTLVDLQTGNTEDLINQRRDPKVTEFDDLNCRLLELQWQKDGTLRAIGRVRTSDPVAHRYRYDDLVLAYDVSSKKWTKLTPPYPDYRQSKNEFFWAGGVPWVLTGTDPKLDIAQGTFTAYLQPRTESGTKARAALTNFDKLAIPVHFEQGADKAALIDPRPGEHDPKPGILPVCRGGTDWVLWIGSNGAVWISPYDDFMKHLNTLAPKID